MSTLPPSEPARQVPRTLASLLAFVLSGEHATDIFAVIRTLAALGTLITRARYVLRESTGPTDINPGDMVALEEIRDRAADAIGVLAETPSIANEGLVTPAHVRRVIRAIVAAEHRAGEQAVAVEGFPRLSLPERWSESALRALEDLDDVLAESANEGPEGPALPPLVRCPSPAWEDAAQLLLHFPTHGDWTDDDRAHHHAIHDRIAADPSFVQAFLEASERTARTMMEKGAAS